MFLAFVNIICSLFKVLLIVRCCYGHCFFRILVRSLLFFQVKAESSTKGDVCQTKSEQFKNPNITTTKEVNSRI